jgi:LexA-binding, inner membrane-associated putative hydrolase
VALSAWLVRHLSKKEPPSLGPLVVPIGAAALLHVSLDLLQWQGVALLWPLRPTRLAANWLPSVDLWILALLIAGIFIPELLRLITSEIGVRDKRPRGRKGAIVALALMVIYVGARAMLHANAAGSLDPHTYKGESARKVAAFPDPISMFTWHGIVETQSLLCQGDVPVGLGKDFDPEAAECVHKPELSGELDAAQKTDVVRKYLRVEPFPRAIVAKTQDRYEVVIRSMRDLAEKETRRSVAAQVVLDARFGVVDEQLVWGEDVHVR